MFENKIFETLCTGTGFIVIVILGSAIMFWLIANLVDWLTNKLFECKHKWEFDDCGDNFIQIRCKKCDEVKYIECDINESEWNIEYTGRND